MTALTPSQKAEVARIMGVDPTDFDVTAPNWAAMLKEGVTAKAHISYWRARTGLTHEFMGLILDPEEIEATEDIIELGMINLMPNKHKDDIGRRLKSIETRSRTLPNRFGVSTYWGNLILFPKFAEFKEACDQLEKEFYGLRNELYERWDFYREQVTDRAAEHGRLAWERVKGLTPEKMSLQDFASQDAFVDRLIRFIDLATPGKEEVYRSFKWTMSLSYIPLPDILAENEAAASAARVWEESERSIAAAKTRQAWAQADEADEKARAAQIENATKAQMIREMNQEVVKKSQEQATELLEGFFTDVIVYSRELVDTVYSAAIDSQESSGKLASRSIVALRNMVEEVSKVAEFNGDVDINELLAPANAILAAGPAERKDTSDELAAKMRQARNIARSQLVSLGAKPRKTRKARAVNPLPIIRQPRQKRKSRSSKPVATVATGQKRSSRKN